MQGGSHSVLVATRRDALAGPKFRARAELSAGGGRMSARTSQELAGCCLHTRAYVRAHRVLSTEG